MRFYTEKTKNTVYSSKVKKLGTAFLIKLFVMKEYAFFDIFIINNYLSKKYQFRNENSSFMQFAIFLLTIIRVEKDPK